MARRVRGRPLDRPDELPLCKWISCSAVSLSCESSAIDSRRNRSREVAADRVAQVPA